MFAGGRHAGDMWRLDPIDSACGVAIDKNGPRIGPVPLLMRGSFGWQPRRSAELNRILRGAAAYPIDLATRRAGLRAAARAMNDGDLARAAICTVHMRLPPLRNETAARRAQRFERLAKASDDDPVHPGWPAGTPGGLGGRFRPKTPGERMLLLPQAPALPAVVGAPALPATTLTTKRAVRFAITARLKAWNDQLADMRTQIHPHDDWNALDRMKAKLRDLNSALLLDEMETMIASLKETHEDIKAAIEFARGGPKTLEELRVSDEDIGFASMDAFKKSDGDEIDLEQFFLEKRFGPAPLGCEYHHVCEQKINLGNIDPHFLHSAINIVILPRLLHIGVSADTSSLIDRDGRKIVARRWLKTQTFDEQYKFGVDQLQRLGIVEK